MCIKLLTTNNFQCLPQHAAVPIKGCLYQDAAPGVMQTERVCLHSQTVSLFNGVLILPLLRIFWHFAIRKSFSLAPFTMLAQSLACLDCLSSKLRK